MGRMWQPRPGDFWAHLLADIALRLVYFTFTAIVLLYSLFRYHHRYEDVGTQLLVLVGAVSTVAAIFGPMLHRLDSLRGRGSLKNTRDKSRRGD